MRDFSVIARMNLSELTNYIVNEFHIPAKEFIKKIKDLGFKIKKTCKIEKNLSLLIEIFNQFEREFLSHIDREEQEFFPEIIKLENWELEDYSNLNKFLHIQDIEHNEIDSYLIWWKNIIKELCLEDNKYYDELKKIMDIFYKESLDHLYIENNILNVKVEEKIA